MDLFGIFDGHGGKQAATFASKHMVPAVLEELEACLAKQQEAEQHENGVAIPSKHSSGAHSEGAALAADVQPVRSQKQNTWRRLELSPCFKQGTR